MSLSNFYADRKAFNDMLQTGQDNALARQAGGMIADGNRVGAANALNRGGQLEAARTIQSDTDAQHKHEVEFAGNLATGIAKRIKAGADPEQAWREGEQYASAQGMTDHVPALRQQWQTMGPEAFTTWLGSAAAKEKQQLVQGPNGQLDAWDGQSLTSLRKGSPEPKVYGDFVYAPESAPETAAAAPASPQPAGGFGAHIGNLMQREGGFVARDGRSGAPANYGINQKYNPDVDVKNLTPEKAQEIYKQRYWDAIGGDSLPPEAQGPVFDAAVNQGPQRAMQWWQQSGGDVAKFNQLRLQHYRSRPDYAQNGKNWERRVSEAGGPQAPLQGGPGGDELSGAPQIPGYRAIGRVKGGGDGKWDVYIDPKTNLPFRYNPATAKATTLDGQPYNPSGASKMSGGGTPRSAAALAVQRFIAENPNATAEDISQFNANLNKERQATTAFGTGKQGQTINSLNVSIDHLSTLGELSGALGNGNIQLLNRAGQKWKEQTGNPAPANFEAAKQIVADEIVKGIVGAGGGVADREKAQAAISNSSSPQQLAGVIETYKHLLAGQLNGLRLQYKNTTGRADFEDKLLPETRAALERSNPTSNAPAGRRPPLSSFKR